MIAFATLYNSYIIALLFMFNISEIMEHISSGDATYEMQWVEISTELKQRSSLLAMNLFLTL